MDAFCSDSAGRDFLPSGVRSKRRTRLLRYLETFLSIASSEYLFFFLKPKIMRRNSTGIISIESQERVCQKYDCCIGRVLIITPWSNSSGTSVKSSRLGRYMYREYR